jgi:uncharacterized protein (DUF4415 family)
MKRVSRKSLSQRIKAEIATLAAMPDEQINTRDIPRTVTWLGAERGRFFRPIKKQLTIRLDGDVIAWFRHYVERGQGYQTHINNALRHYVWVAERGTKLQLKGWHAGNDLSLKNLMQHEGLSAAKAKQFTWKIVEGKSAVTVTLPKMRDPLAVAERFRAIGVEEVAIILPASQG